MKIRYDDQVDTAYIQLSDLVPSGVIELAAGVNLDVTEDGAIVGIEMLDASKKFPLETLFRCEYEPEMFLSHH